MKALWRPIFFFLAVGAVPSSAENLGYTQFAMHRKATTTKATTICTTYSPNASAIQCPQYTVVGPGTGYSLVYLVIGFGPDPGVSGASFGIDYNGRASQFSGIDPLYVQFYPCFDGTASYWDGGFGEFPAPKGAAAVTWNTCSNTQVGWSGIHAIIGALRLYAFSEDVLRIIPNTLRSAEPELLVVDCTGREIELLALHPGPLPYTEWGVGRVHFGGDGRQGKPCYYPDPVRPATWGEIKNRFGN